VSSWLARDGRGQSGSLGDRKQAFSVTVAGRHLLTLDSNPVRLVAARAGACGF